MERVAGQAMDEEQFEYEIIGGRQRVIKRPRLTRMLDDSKARILLLLAPAGYGKTTLARQWLAENERASGWYTGGPAASDVAALCLELADAACAVVPAAGRRMRDRLTATPAPEREVGVLAELLAEDLADWPANAWLAFDDYQYAERPAAEEFVELLLRLSPVHMILTTRRRPAWATARRAAYGELVELGQLSLAFEMEEAKLVLCERPAAESYSLIQRAKGWPAVVRLAALSPEPRNTEAEVVAGLYEYFAEEMFQAATPALQDGLMASNPAAPKSHRGLPVVGASVHPAEILCVEGLLSLAFSPALSAVIESIELHPLLRDFLESKFRGTTPFARHFLEDVFQRLHWRVTVG